MTNISFVFGISLFEALGHFLICLTRFFNLRVQSQWGHLVFWVAAKTDEYGINVGRFLLGLGLGRLLLALEDLIWLFEPPEIGNPSPFLNSSISLGVITCPVELTTGLL